MTDLGLASSTRVVIPIQNSAYQASLEARFAIAARHSRIVRILRVAVPGAVILALTSIILVSIFNPFRMLLPKLPLDIGNLVVSGTKITMESPHLSGYSPDRRPYEVWAKTAIQDVASPNRVELNTLRSKVAMALAIMVLPQPAMPTSKMPLGGFRP